MHIRFTFSVRTVHYKIVIYRHEFDNVIFLQNMEDLLFHLVSENDVIIKGDFNIDWRKNSPAKQK